MDMTRDKLSSFFGFLEQVMVTVAKGVDGSFIIKKIEDIFAWVSVKTCLPFSF